MSMQQNAFRHIQCCDEERFGAVDNLISELDHVLQCIFAEDHKPPGLRPAMCWSPIGSLQHLLNLTPASAMLIN